MNHLGDTNKMVSDTPRTDAEYERLFEIYQNAERINGPLCCAFENDMRLCGQLERELNAASKQRDDALMMLGMYRMKSDEQKQRIKRLEEAGDFLSRYLREMPYASDYLAQVDERILRISNWRRAKEDNL